MKRLLPFIFTWLALSANAQNSTVFQDNMNVIYQYVDRTPVTTGLLLDYGLLLNDVSKFNGTLQTNNYVNRNVWATLYASLYFMKFNSNATLGSPGSVNTQINNYLVADGSVRDVSNVSSSYLAVNNSVIDLIGLHYQYEQFKSNAASSNLVYVVNNQIYDTPNRPATPYEIKDAFAITPTTSNLQGNNHIFRLRSDLFFKNVSKTVSAFQADFGDGLGMRNVGIGSDVNVNYTSDSVKTIVFQITYTDGQVLQSRSLVNLSGTSKICSNCRYSNPSAAVPFPNVNINFPVAVSQMGTGKVTIATAGNDGILDKPLIIVEGFDPDNRYNYYSLIDPFAKGQLSVKVNIDYQGETFAQLLEANNYDLVFLDFDNGTDDIKRNAYLLENLIYWVNQQTAAVGSTQKNVVLGISMGGLISRYALRDMELRNVNHNTRLYCSLDSPHQGANVPLGVQAAVRYLAGFNISIGGVTLFELSPDITAAYNLLNSPGASQMLTYELTGSGSSIAIDNTLHNNFQSDYSSVGMPRLWGIRNLAIANGSECANTQGFSPYSQMLTGSGTTDFNYIAGIFFSMVEAAKTANPLVFFEGFLTTSSNLQMNLEIRTLPNLQSQRIFYFDIYYHKTILFGLAQSGSDMINFSFNSSAALLPLDSNPGGVYDVNQFARIPQSVAGINLNALITRFDFVPTTSSLDVGSGTQTITNSDYLRAYSPTAPPASPKNIPFNNFFTNPLANENHAYFTSNNAKWLWQEMQGTPAFYSCSYECSGTSIVPIVTGASAVCSQGSTYYLTNLPQGATVQYFSSNTNGVTISPLSTDPTKGVAKEINGFKGNVTLTAQVTGSCGSAYATPLTVFAGTPLADNSTLIYVAGKRGTNPVTLTTGGTYSFQCDPVTGATSFTWVLPSGFSFYSGSTSSSPWITTSLTTGSYTLYCSANNQCGASWTHNLGITISTGGGGGGGAAAAVQMSSYPNPTSSTLSVSVTDSLSSDTQTGLLNQPYQLIIYDKQSKKVFSIRSSDKLLEIPVGNLPNDIYYLKFDLQGHNLAKTNSDQPLILVLCIWAVLELDGPLFCYRV